MAKGGNIYGIEKYLSRNLINHITSLNKEQLKKMEKELQGEIDRSEKYEKDFKGSNREFALKKELDLINYRLEDEMAMGGVTFKEKVKSIKSSLLQRKKVSPKVQKDYGKTYSPKEAEESAKRIVGAMTAKERLMKSMKKGKK
jgi:hypothetical protein